MNFQLQRKTIIRTMTALLFCAMTNSEATSFAQSINFGTATIDSQCNNNHSFIETSELTPRWHSALLVAKSSDSTLPNSALKIGVELCIDSTCRLKFKSDQKPRITGVESDGIKIELSSDEDDTPTAILTYPDNEVKRFRFGPDCGDVSPSVKKAYPCKWRDKTTIYTAGDGEELTVLQPEVFQR